MFCIYLRTNSDLCHLQHKLIGIYNRDEKCLLRGTNLVFKSDRYSFVLKGLMLYLRILIIVISWLSDAVVSVCVSLCVFPYEGLFRVACLLFQLFVAE